MCITYPRGHNLSRYAQAEGAGGAAGPGRPPHANSVESAGRSAGPGRPPRATSEESAGGAEARPGFEPTRRTKLATRRARGRAGPAPGNPVAHPAGTPMIRHDLVDEQIGPDTCVRYRARMRL